MTAMRRRLLFFYSCFLSVEAWCSAEIIRKGHCKVKMLCATDLSMVAVCRAMHGCRGRATGGQVVSRWSY